VVNLIIEMFLSGFFFLFIIVTNIASGKFGYQTFSKLDSDSELERIHSNPRNFKIGFGLILTEHIAIILLVVMLFLAFNAFSLILAVIWSVSRVTEAIIQIYYKKNYWSLLRISEQYSTESGSSRESMRDLARSILKKKNSVFTFAQILFSVGTISYSILFVFYGVVPELIGWFGAVASIIYGFGSGIALAKPSFKTLWNIGALLILIFEIIVGGFLLISPWI
jgi:Domain of unknown function (DUF4386)